MSLTFDEFKTVSKKEWVDKINADLKGVPIDSLRWEIEDELTIDPFITNESKSHSPRNNLTKSVPGWVPGQWSYIHDEKESNKHIIDALEGGIRAIYLESSRDLIKLDLDSLFDQVRLDWIEVHWRLSLSNELIWSEWLDFLTGRIANHKDWSGSIDFKWTSFMTNMESADIKSFISNISQTWPLLRFVRIDGSEEYNLDPSIQLSRIVYKVNSAIQFLINQGLSTIQACSAIYISMRPGKDLFEDIAMTRSVRVLWANLMAGYGIKDLVASIEKQIPTKKTTCFVHHLIPDTLFAISAVLGTADRIIIDSQIPENAKAEIFNRRMARNVQNILQLESHLNKVDDPLAGSYLIEEMTFKLSKKAWDQFRSMTTKAGGK